MAKKLDKQQLVAASSLIVVGAKAANEVWDALNKDQRVSNALRGLKDQLGQAASGRSPEARLSKQLDLIDDYALKAAEKPNQGDQATRWLQQSTAIRQKLPLVAAQRGRAKRVNQRDLEHRTATLLAEIISGDLEDGVDPPGV